MKMAKQIVSMRLDVKKIERLSKILNYFGLGNNNTEVVEVALNNLENVLQGYFTVNLIDAIERIKEQNIQIMRLKKQIYNLKSNTEHGLLYYKDKKQASKN
jgi:hypothetical protein